MDDSAITRLPASSQEELLKLARSLNLKREKAPAQPSIVRIDRTEDSPASYAQQRLWFLAQIKEASQVYHVTYGLQLEGTLNREALRSAFTQIVARHDALRTTFALVDGELIQQIASIADISRYFEEHDLTQRDNAALELDRLAAEATTEAFDLESGPLVRARLIRVGEQKHVLLIVMHHIVADAWSVGVLAKELSLLYGGIRSERERLPELELQYADYAVWHRHWVESTAQEEAEYWKTTLEGAPAVLDLPADQVRPEQQDYRGASVDFVLDRDLTAALKQLSKRSSTTLFMTLLAGFATLLMRLSGQEDVVVGVPAANRERPEIEGLIGFFVNMLAVRLDMSGEPSVTDLLNRVKKQSLAAQQHQDIPFEQVVEAVRPVRSVSHNPLFQAVLAWENTPEVPLEFPGVEVKPFKSTSTSRAKFDLTLELRERDGIIVGDLEYATALFKRTTIERFAEYLKRLLTAMAADETQTLNRLQMLGEAERAQILYQWNATEREYPHDKRVHEVFEELAAKNPEAVAVVYEDQKLTYAELNSRANKLAQHLQDLGVGPESRVAICMERSPEMLEAVLAALKAGAGYVPLDPEYPADRLKFMLEDSRPHAVLTKGQAGRVIEDLGTTAPVVNLARAAAWSNKPGMNRNGVIRDLPSGDLAYVMYTSGSTGNPKGVMVEHRSILRLVINNGYADFNAEDRVVFGANPAFDAATMEIWGALLNGSCLIIIDQNVLLNPARFAAELREKNVSILWLTAGVYRSYARDLSEALSRLRYLIVGGDAVSPEAVAETLAHGRPQHLLNGYGPTETTTFATTFEITEPPQQTRTIPIGRPIGNTRVYILDALGEPVPVGVVGEIHIGGDGVARGYWKRSDLTRERFSADPFAARPEARMFKTGDLGRWLADGNIEFLGRNDQQVKLRGFRIELGEIEARLSEYPGIRQAVVVTREDEAGDKRLFAYYTSEPGTWVQAEELRAHLTEKLPDYMLPAAYVCLEQIPLTTNGKLDRKKLPEPDASAYGAPEYEAPEGDAEEALAEIWSELLGVEQVGRSDNFFELGGHSLLAVRMIERMKQQGFEVTLRALFETPSLATLAESIGGAIEKVEIPPNGIAESCQFITPAMLALVDLTEEEIAEIVRRTPGGARNIQDIYPLAPLQEGILFHHLMEAEGDPYLLGELIRFASRERMDSYLEALQWVVGRHEILRTVVLWEGLREPVQVVWRKAQIAVEEVELEGIGPVAERLYELFDPRHHRMDIRQAPMLRAYAAKGEIPGQWFVVILLHHLAGDHSTMEVLHEEIEGYLLGRTERLPEPQPFRNLVARARLGHSEAEHEAFFRELLGDLEEPTAPFGLLDIRGDGSGIEEAIIQLDSSLVERLRDRARKLKVSTATLCHLAWACVVARTSGRNEAVFGSVLFGRMGAGESAARAMGLFINTLPVRIPVGEDAIENTVRKTHSLLAQLVRHEHAPLALARKCSRVQALAPLFTSLFNYRHIKISSTEHAARVWEGMEWLRRDERTNYPLMLSVNDFREGMSLTAQTRAPLDPQRICEFMRTALERLVEALKSTPEQGISRIDVLPSNEREGVLYEWNAVNGTYACDTCVHESFEHQAARFAEAVAVIHGGQELTYAELNARANRLAHYLRELGVAPDERVVICVERSLDLIVAVLAVLKAGGAYVPLDPDYPAERLKLVIEDTEPRAVLTQTHLRGLIDGLSSTAPVIELNEDSAWRDRPVINPQRDGLTPQHLAYIIYTSGSTGTPKGVMVEHANVARLFTATQQWFQFRDTDVWTLFHSYAFDFSVWELWGALIYGGRLVIVPKETTRSPEEFYQLLCQTKVTVLNQTPSAFQQLIGISRKREQTHQLRYVILGGEALDVSILKPWFEHAESGSTQIVNMYGITETTVHVTYCPLTNDETGKGGPSRIGSRIPDLRLYILDEQRRPAPTGVVGEIYVGGAGVARGYWKRPDLTIERFLKDPFVSELDARIYKTGDLGRWSADGQIEFFGRNDEQVKIRGFRIELGEIAARLAEHAEVHEAVIVAREDRVGSRHLIAYYTSAQRGGLPAEELRAYLAKLLPEYMVPPVYVWLEAMPLTANGKLDHKGLPEPDKDAFATREYEAPQGLAEQALAEVWSELLGVERVGRRDNFFELGGHSLLAIRMVERMRQRGMEVDLRGLFETPTLSLLAESIAAASQTLAIPPNGIQDGSEFISPEMLPLVDLNEEEIERIVQETTAGAANIQDIYPLAPLQEGILFHHLMSGEGDPYLLTDLMRFPNRERMDSYLKALDWVVGRHDVLRTAVLWEGLRAPVQVVWRQAQIPVQVLQLEGSDAAERLYELFNPRQHRMDITRAPMLRAYVAEEKETGQWLLLTLLHHLAGDHSTLDVMHEEIEAYLLDQTERLPDPEPFRNMVAHARLGQNKAEHEAFFRHLLGDIEEPTAPFGLIDVQGDVSGIEEAGLELDSRLVRRMRERARKLKVSAATLCHLAWACVVARTSGRSEAVFGSVLFGRMNAGAGSERAMGLFINTLPVRIAVGNDGVEDAVRKTHKMLAQLVRHEHASLALAQRCSRVISPAPLFTSLFNYRHMRKAASPEAARIWDGIEWLRGEERTNYPFGLSVNDFGEEISLNAQTLASVDPLRTCEFMRTALESLINALERAPKKPVCTIEVLPVAERNRVLYEWNATHRDYALDKCVHKLFEDQAFTSPEAVAVVYEDQELTYDELNRRANQLAHHLRQLGVSPDARVGICLQRGPEMVEAVLAVLKAGGAYVPLDPDYPGERLRFMVKDSEPHVVLMQSHLRAALQELSGQASLVHLDEDAAWRSHPTTNPDVAKLTPENLAYIIYTSGSTGTPKGVMVEHRAWANLAQHHASELQAEPGSRVLQFVSFSFDVWCAESMTALSRGAALCLSSLATVSRTEDLSRTVGRGGQLITHAFLPVSILPTLLSNRSDWTSVHTIVAGGDRLTSETARMWGNGRRLINAYGPTETTICATMYECRGDELGDPPIGRPIANTRLYILDTHGEPLPVGVVGEIHIGGAGVARGYWNRPELTANRFLRDPFVDDEQARMYKTGDLGRWLADGNVEIVGRNDQQVKLRGFRIELGEIEVGLAQHPQIREAAVVARETSSGDKRLFAYYVSEQDESITTDDLRAYLAAKLPDYMLPAAYMRMDAMPLTANGKLDRKRLPEPDVEAYAVQEYESPQGETEQALAEIWSELLGVERVGRSDNFFELGGHSLLSMRMMERMRQRGLRVDLPALYESPTLSSFADSIARAEDIDIAAGVISKLQIGLDPAWDEIQVSI